jgi:hypothetical protein
MTEKSLGAIGPQGDKFPLLKSPLLIKFGDEQACQIERAA